MAFRRVPESEFNNLQINPVNFEAGTLLDDNGKIIKVSTDKDDDISLKAEVDNSTAEKLFEPKPGDISDIKCYLSEKAIQYYRSLADEKGELTLSCVCDSTFLFLFTLYKTLELAGFTDITIEDREAKPEEIPKDKPYCSWYYGVTGKLPKE